MYFSYDVQKFQDCRKLINIRNIHKPNLIMTSEYIFFKSIDSVKSLLFSFPRSIISSTSKKKKTLHGLHNNCLYSIQITTVSISGDIDIKIIYTFTTRAEFIFTRMRKYFFKNYFHSRITITKFCIIFYSSK